MPRSRLQEPWFPLSCKYYRNGKVEDAGAAAALCHQYLIALARNDGGYDDGRQLLTEWDENKIYRFIGCFKSKFTRAEIRKGMDEAVHWQLVEYFEDQDCKWVRPYDYEAFVKNTERDLAARKMREYRARIKRESSTEETIHPPKPKTKTVEKPANVKLPPIPSLPKEPTDSPASGTAQKIIEELLKRWPTLELMHAMDISQKIRHHFDKFGEKRGLEIITEAWERWPSDRKVFWNGRNSLLPYIVSTFQNEGKFQEKKKKEEKQTYKSKGESIGQRVLRLHKNIAADRTIDPTEFRQVVNQCREDGRVLSSNIEQLIHELSSNGQLELTRARKIEGGKWVDPERPSILRKGGAEDASPDDVKNFCRDFLKGQLPVEGGSQNAAGSATGDLE